MRVSDTMFASRKMSLAAVLSGFLGATASCFAKLVFGSLLVQVRCESYCSPEYEAACYWIELLVARGIGLGCMIACNILQLGSFLEGMESAGSVAGTAYATAANFTASAFYGYVFWDERFSTVWWAGFGMVLTGVALLSSASQRIDHSKSD